MVTLPPRLSESIVQAPCQKLRPFTRDSRAPRPRPLRSGPGTIAHMHTTAGQVEAHTPLLRDMATTEASLDTYPSAPSHTLAPQFNTVLRCRTETFRRSREDGCLGPFKIRGGRLKYGIAFVIKGLICSSPGLEAE